MWRDWQHNDIVTYLVGWPAAENPLAPLQTAEQGPYTGKIVDFRTDRIGVRADGMFGQAPLYYVFPDDILSVEPEVGDPKSGRPPAEHQGAPGIRIWRLSGEDMVILPGQWTDPEQAEAAAADLTTTTGLSHVAVQEGSVYEGQLLIELERRTTDPDQQPRRAVAARRDHFRGVQRSTTSRRGRADRLVEGSAISPRHRVQYRYNTQIAEGFDEVYGLGHDAVTNLYRTSILSGAPAIYPDQRTLDATALAAAKQYREDQQARVPNFTDDDARFDAAWASGYIVATVAEQDAYLGDPDGYRAELQERYAPGLPIARVVDAEASGQLPGQDRGGDQHDIS